MIYYILSHDGQSGLVFGYLSLNDTTLPFHPMMDGVDLYLVISLFTTRH